LAAIARRYQPPPEVHAALQRNALPDCRFPASPAFVYDAAMNAPVAADTPAPLTAGYFVIDDFLPLDLALSMRADIDAHFGETDKHRAETHQVWNYWYVPGTYTYLRTVPDKIMVREKVERFMSSLQDWTVTRMGLGEVTWPILSLYIPGCFQNLHNDSLNGRFAYVYSLTNPVRKTQGGGTILMNEGDSFRRNLANPMTYHGISKVVEPRFNRLVLFDDRVIHGVERIEGSMDPVEGRFVLHGHIRDRGPFVGGALAIEALLPQIQSALGGFVAANGEESYNFHGPISVRFTVEPDGAVSDLHVLLDRVTHVADQHAGRWEELRPRYLAAFAGLRFAAASGPTTVIFPVVFAGPAGRPPAA
jgi:Rps23 Pro-64 3,4-dihydroxylase Tpa1-like proline 4-hydroxylase